MSRLSSNFDIEPQRDSFKGTPEGADGSTWFVKCEECEADHWAVFDISGDDPELIDDFPSRDAAEAFIASWE